MKNPTINYERLFKITRKKNAVNLSESMSVINGKASKENFETEVYQMTFCAIVKGKKKECNLLVTVNECICEEEKENLRNQLGVVINGSGMYFEILSYETNFSIQFDTIHSVFVDTDSVKNGKIFFFKK
ncbi:hypothetical protein [Tenacibaculum sp.]|uniref:hypothetical protein n=1 Tax=Tenacibaculum sp. TaxID=1906242 RepID=UPI003D0B9803